MKVIQSDRFTYKDEKKEKCEVSIVVVTYNSNLSKLEATLNSICLQKNIRFEIIISDDGSAINYVNESIQFLEEKEFFDYIGIINEKNIGTVNNCYNAIRIANGKYVKLISPGDELCSDILRDWIDFIEENHKYWSFGDAFYYNAEQEMNKKIISCPCNPQIINCYNSNKEKLCRWNYLVFGDLVLGATIICQREIMIKYLSMISDKVVYAEDDIYRIMMFENIIPCYYPQEVIFYEYGTGISNCGNKIWEERLHKDWVATDEIMFGNKQFDIFQKKIYKAYMITKKNSKLKAWILLKSTMEK